MLNKSALCELARSLNGLPVYGCLPGSPAERAGVRYGDVLLSVDGVTTSTWDEYIAVRRRSGATICCRLFRDGSEFVVEIPLDRSASYGAVELSFALGLHERASSS
ncbi:MAG: PDZ domain-containing protein [Deltaproteobacteria bacterium]|nr:PDZ domain-containing protein [Deltaproteobacteria bacterium]